MQYGEFRHRIMSGGAAKEILRDKGFLLGDSEKRVRSSWSRILFQPARTAMRCYIVAAVLCRST